MLYGAMIVPESGTLMCDCFVTSDGQAEPTGLTECPLPCRPAVLRLHRAGGLGLVSVLW